VNERKFVLLKQKLKIHNQVYTIVMTLQQYLNLFSLCVCVTKDGTQDLVLARKVLHHLSLAPIIVFLVRFQIEFCAFAHTGVGLQSSHLHLSSS
jgi:hypothetical protein